MTRQGNLLKSRRAALKLTLADIARLLNPGVKITPSRYQIIWNWEMGKQAITSHKVRAVAEAYQIDFDDIVYEMTMDYAAKIRRENAKIISESDVS